MRAAVVRALGAAPEVVEVDDVIAGAGSDVVKIISAGLNPIDVLLASGQYGPTPVPHVIGREGVGELGDGTRVYFSAAGPPHGAVAEQAVVQRDATFVLPDALTTDMAIAIGAAGLAAWLALTEQAALQPGESVLVLGASGAVGQLATQAAKALGASRVVGAARNVAAIDRDSVDAVVSLGNEFQRDLRDCARDGFDVVIDPLGGAALEAALSVLADGGRVVTLGVMAGDTVTVPLRALQGRRLIGHSARFFGHAVKLRAYTAMTDLALGGGLSLTASHYALSDIGEAWRAQSSSPNKKLLIDL